MRFVIYTKAERGLASLSALLKRDLVPALCVSEDGDTATVGLCRERNVPVVIEKKPKQAGHIEAVHKAGAELLVCAGYSKILPAALFEPLKLGGINCHGGRLPQYRGASPIPWQIIQGETVGAAYVLRLTAGIDDGPVLATEPYSIDAADTARRVTDKVTAIFSRIVPEVVQAFAHGRAPAGVPQSEEGACHWTRRVPADGEIDWRGSTVKQVVDLVRALDDPYPGAFVMHKGARIIVRSARRFDRMMAGVPGRCIGRTAEGLLILARDGAVEILNVETDGVRMPAQQTSIAYGDTFRVAEMA